jgi:hypothetical protein
MNQNAIHQKIALHHAFWEGKPLKRPLVSFQLDDYFVSKRIKAAAHLLTEGKKITPEMLVVESFLDDFERMYQESCQTGQDAFWVAEPFCGIPWMEAIFGCEIYGMRSSFISHPCIESAQDLKKIKFDPENAWFKKYLEFVKKLDKLSAGRFPVGQPIMRGASDVVGALLGQTELVYALADEAQVIREAFFKVMNALRSVIEAQWDATTDFHGGYSMGFYYVWCPKKCIWFQEDVSALLSPQIYNDFLREPDASVCKGYDYTAVHLHPASFFVLDMYMQMDGLKAIQINKDVGGPSIKEMMPNFKKVLTKKNLIIFGDLDEEEIDCILEELPRKGTFLNITAPTVERAKELMEHIEKRS